MRLLLIFIFILPVVLEAQTSSTGIKVAGKITNNGLLKIRWFTESNTVWHQGLQHGYILEKATYDNKKAISNQDFSIIQEIRKWDEPQVIQALSRYQPNSVDHKYINVSFELSKADGTLQPGVSFEEAMEFKEQLDLVYGYAMIASLMSWEGAKVQAMAFDTRDFSSTDIYRISLNAKIEGLQVSPAYFTMDMLEKEESYLKKINVEESEKSIGLKWKKSKDVFASFVEYSSDGRNYISDIDLPNIQLSSNGENKDSLTYGVDSLVNGQLYFFKVYGQNVFGERIFIGEAQGTPRDRTPPSRPVLLGVKHLQHDLVQINWSSSTLDSDLAGYAVGRSTDPFGQYYQIHEGLIPISWTSFEDRFFDRDTTNYYVIEAVDKNGNRSRSNYAYLTLTDSIPPEIPIPISGVMDSLGIVTIELEPQGEKDFMGYRIYKANDPDHEFSVVQETYNDTIVAQALNPIIIDTSTLESLTPFIYYHVTALDYHYNESKFSEVIKIPRPDKYPPVPPLISDYQITDEGIIFTFIASTSKDVARNTLYVKSSTSAEWEALHSFYQDTSYLYIPDKEVNGMVAYAASAEDVSGLVSEYGNVLKIRSIVKPKVLDLELACTYYPESNLCHLEWKLSDEDISIEYFHSISYQDVNGTKYLGLSKYSNGIVFKTDQVPSVISINSRSKTREYLPFVREGCILNEAKPTREELSSKLARYEKN